MLNHWIGSDLPLINRPGFASKHLDEVHHHMSRMFCAHDLRTEGGNPPINFRHHHAALRTVSFNATDYGNPYGKVHVTIPPMEELYLVQVSLAGSARITSGGSTFELKQGEMCVLNPDVKVEQVFGDGYRHFTVKFLKSSLTTLLAQELGFKVGHLTFRSQPLRAEGAALSFAQLVSTVCLDLDSGASAFSHGRVVDALEHTLQRLLLATFPHNQSEFFDTAGTSPAPYYVKRVEEFIHQHPADPITLEEMIAVAGVSARSLHAGFRRFRGTTPMNYLKNCRLVLARRQLQEAAETGLTVTEVAMGCGFTHLSKFARDYYEKFGERPSATLKRLSLH